MAERITKALIKTHQFDSETFIFDTEVRGLAVRFRPGCAPSYVFRYSNGKGAKKVITIGPALDISPDDARKAAQNHRRNLTLGVDPRSEKARIKKIPTVAEFAAIYLEQHAIPYKKPGSVKNDKTLWRMHVIPLYGHERVDHIEERHILTIKAKLAKKPATANQAIALLSKAFNLAEKWGFRPKKSNPCYQVEKFPPRKRERILSPEELDQLGKALAKHRDECPEVVNLIYVLLFTGARLNEVMKAVVDQYDKPRGILILHDSKTGQGQIELSSAARGILDSIDRKNSDWLVPGPFEGQPIRSPWNAWRRICKTAGLTNLRLHDLRHIFGSYSHRAGVSQKMIATLLRHQQLSTTERYIQGFNAEAKEAADKTASVIATMLGK